MDGSVVMWEFGNPRPVSTQIPPGSGASVTMIRFTPEGNKVNEFQECFTMFSVWNNTTFAKVPSYMGNVVKADLFLFMD